MVGRIIPTRVGTSEQVVTMDGETQDHPHACGDKLPKTGFAFSFAGSSPRVWGQARLFFRTSDNDRIIPTRVGTSHSRYLLLSAREDHPHACGDKNMREILFRAKLGSSPRVWGQVCHAVAVADGEGIIPTRVGTSSAELLLPSGETDHPHACGDKQLGQ